MRNTAAILLILLLFAATAQAAMPKAGDTLPDAQVKSQLRPEEAKYLGLPEGTTSFRLSQINAEALIVEVYSMYCPTCQAEAGRVNTIFERLTAAPQAARVRFLGIGAGNTPYEIEYFRKKHPSAMPLLADEDYGLHKTFMNVRTPSFFVLKKLPTGGFTVVFYREGGFIDDDAFFKQILGAATR